MYNLFDIVSPNFFNIFMGSSKYMYANILYVLYQNALERNSFTFKKEEFVDIIENYLQQNEFVFDIYTEAGLKTTRDQATHVYRRIKECNWIDEENSTNQEILVNFEDYAIAFLNTFVNFNKNNSFELSSYVYNIFQTLKNFDVNKGYLTLHTIIENSNDLINRLRSLNSNIKKYINRMIQLNNLSDTELLSRILGELLGEYKEKVIDKAYYYMKTNDNPVKYKSEFLRMCRDIQNDNNKYYLLTRQIIKEDNISYEDALTKLNEMFLELESIFDRVINIVEEIDRKNSKYISTAIEKVKIIMNHNTDIEGLILNILKNINYIDEFEFSILNKKNIKIESLYTPRTIKKIERTILEEEVNLDNLETIEMMKNAIKYSKKKIETFVDNKLKKFDKLTIENFNFKDKEEFIKFILMFAYKDTSNIYRIKSSAEMIKYDGIEIQNFIVERK